MEKKDRKNNFANSEEGLVKDLNKSLKQTIDQIFENLDELVETVKTTVRDESIYEDTKNIVKSIYSETKFFEEE